MCKYHAQIKHLSWFHPVNSIIIFWSFGSLGAFFDGFMVFLSIDAMDRNAMFAIYCTHNYSPCKILIKTFTKQTFNTVKNRIRFTNTSFSLYTWVNYWYSILKFRNVTSNKIWQRPTFCFKDGQKRTVNLI